MSRDEYQSLKPLRGTPRQHRIMALDTEDDQRGYGKRSGFYLGVIVSDYGAKTFRRRYDLIRYLTQPRWSGYWCACHNLEYDMLNIFGPEKIVQMDPIFSGSKLCGLSIPVRGKKDQYVQMWDTSCFMPQSLRKLAPLVGMEKLEMEHRPGKRTVTRKELEYAVADTEITFKLGQFIQEGANNLGAQLKLTAAATSLDCFRREYQSGAIPCLPEEVQADLMKGYYGGRVECFRLGDYEGELFSNDFNGMYVSVMIDSELPDISSISPKRTADFSREGMAHCRLKVPEHLWAGPLPFRAPKTGKLTFPVGEIDGWWTYNELRVALNYGVRIDRTYECYHSTRSEPYLREMMISLRQIRENPKTPGPVSQLAKLLGNSLYGKFCQRTQDFKYFRITDYSRMVRTGNFRGYDPASAHIYDAFGLVKMVKPMKFARHSNVIWGACITGGARTKLYSHIDEESTYYCDTDSIIGEKGYPSTKKLGALALKDPLKRLIIRGNKFYAGEKADTGKWEPHTKGIPRDQALNAVMNPSKPITSRRPVKLRTALRGKERANKWVEITKMNRLSYDKRVVNSDGSTRPLVMGRDMIQERA